VGLRWFANSPYFWRYFALWVLIAAVAIALLLIIPSFFDRGPLGARDRPRDLRAETAAARLHAAQLHVEVATLQMNTASARLDTARVEYDVAKRRRALLEMEIATAAVRAVAFALSALPETIAAKAAPKLVGSLLESVGKAALTETAKQMVDKLFGPQSKGLDPSTLTSAPIAFGPVKVGPVTVGVVRAGAIRTGPVRADVVRSGPVKTGSVQTGSVTVDRVNVRGGASVIGTATAFLWFNRTWGRDDREPFEGQARKHGTNLSDLYRRHPTVRHVLGIAS
jgi:hypothetical protein